MANGHRRTTAVSVFVVFFLLLGDTFVAASAVPAASGRQTVDLNRDWRFLRWDAPGAAGPGFDDSAWARVTVPHTWNAEDGQDGGGDYYRGVGWYRRSLVVPPRSAGRKLWLQFDGANTTTVVWVNGVRLGEHKGGYARFRFDATSVLRPGRDNLIAVSVSNAADSAVAPLSGDFTMGGGLYRDVSLVVTDRVHVDMLDFGGPGVYLRQRVVAERRASIEVTTKLAGGTAKVRTRITGERGTPVAQGTTGVRAAGTSVTQTLVIDRPRLWAGRADPFTYQVVVDVLDPRTGRIMDTVTEPLGVRTVAVDPAEGLRLNGDHVRVQGVNLHQDRIGKGFAISPSELAEDFRLMAEMGVNAVRTAHYQHGPGFYELADRYGFLVWTEIPLVNLTDASPEFRTVTEQQTSELVRQNFNHPSVVFWGLGNELWNDTPQVNELVAALTRQVTAERPGGMTAYASCCVWDRGVLNSHAEISGYNKYFGWYTDSTADFGKWADELHAADPRRKIGMSEYGAGASVHQHAERPARPVPDSDWHPEEYQSKFHEDYWRAIESRPYLWGGFVWVMFDFASDGRSEGDTYGRNDKGLVTGDRRIRKDAYYWYQANWTSTPVVHLTSGRWTSRTASVTDVKAYTNADTVTLHVNGRQIGAARSGADRAVVWPEVSLNPGPNVVTVSGVKDGRMHTDQATWTLTG
ncbi:glycoside hydrolase family 2 TIM barrel-domain containing protein [Amycolatopsis sp. lyj-112]|uniref:glycoside hydrolase family 2 protein n=1 Tax=Amycolatopsis sp. lyj-112 TaxID=2789288 RepID=UPI00397CB2C3